MWIWAGDTIQSTARKQMSKSQNPGTERQQLKVEIVLSEGKMKMYMNEWLAVSEAIKKGVENIPSEIDN